MSTLPPAAQADEVPWRDPPPAHRERRRLHVKVRTEAGYEHEYDGLFTDTFAAYDDALTRFAFAARIDVKPIANPGAKPTTHPAPQGT